MLSTLKNLWLEDAGQISEYALIVAAILLLAMAAILHEGKAIHKLYSGVDAHIPAGGSSEPRK